MKEILCESCSYWVDCGKRDNKPYGFCLCQDLFTYTAETRCGEYSEDKPLTEEEFEHP